ncbi:hypothetical protein [Roseicyclus sp.]|uniref:hypothetical protein n=1 Tax=Roseicyclus sp. TaxID=1914329 RepID=UPI001BCF70BB|nr:hypothetical protein [Roseicyclus sp.]
MPTLEELLKKHGVTPMDNPSSGPRAKLLSQADRMIKEIGNYEHAGDMNAENAKFWWAPQAVNGKRKLTAKYGGRAVDGMSTYVDDSLDAVKAMLNSYKAIIEDSDDATWAAEEDKRKS